MSLKAIVDRAVSRGLAPFPEVTRSWAERTATAQGHGDVPWTPFTRRFADSRVAVVTSGGFHRHDQPGFDCDKGDASFREIPGDVDLGALAISHTHYDTRDARRDPNILLPLDRLRELVSEGALASIAPTHYSLMGFIPDVSALVEVTAPEIARRLLDEGVDVALLTPA